MKKLKGFYRFEKFLWLKWCRIRGLSGRQMCWGLIEVIFVQLFLVFFVKAARNYYNNLPEYKKNPHKYKKSYSVHKGIFFDTETIHYTKK